MFVIEGMRDSVGSGRPAVPLPEDLVNDSKVVIEIIELILFFMLLLLFFHNILDGELDFEKFLFFCHFAAHETTVKGAVPLVLVFLGWEFEVQLLFGFGFVFIDGECDEDVGMGVVFHVLDFGHLDDFRGLLWVEILEFELVES